ncbi:hypothetical protein MKW98_009559 [Papaver atlanticum]|uniref:Phytocyanin domain-containing protein n=1 Tax=Papaver atlanticum TaxID=357466 RepID=A0AAD4SEB3_9MAGN|nr:hypothetical protein MKW98_009559 [Papaver atlanticum]
MGVVERVMFFIALAVLCVASTAEVYMVGDDHGWNINSLAYYKEWYASKAFKIGDSIVFEYAPERHNVVQVTYENYNKCNASSPIKTFNSGKDTIPIKANGHYFYICGIPNHCGMGQKVNIRVVSRDSPVTPTPPSGITVPSSSTPAPPPSTAVTFSKDLIGTFGFVVLAAVAAVA